MLERAMPLVINLDTRETYSSEADVTLYHGDCRDLLRQIPVASAHLIVTSPPYNIGKKYETKKALAEKVGLPVREVELLINSYRLDMVPIASSSAGYWYPRDTAELAETLAALRRRIISQSQTYRAQRRALRRWEARTEMVLGL